MSKGGGWTTVKDFNLSEFVDRSPYKLVEHSPKKMKSTNYSICRKCGLVYLKNDFTRWALNKGCENDKHPQYQQMRKKFGEL